MKKEEATGARRPPSCRAPGGAGGAWRCGGGAPRQASRAGRPRGAAAAASREVSWGQDGGGASSRASAPCGAAVSARQVPPLHPPPPSLLPSASPRPLTPLCFLGRFSDGDIDRDPAAAARVRGGERRGRGREVALLRLSPGFPSAFPSLFPQLSLLLSLLLPTSWGSAGLLPLRCPPPRGAPWCCLRMHEKKNTKPTLSVPYK